MKAPYLTINTQNLPQSLPENSPHGVLHQGITPQEEKTNSYFQHLNAMNESYWTHFKAAMAFSFKSFQASVYLFVHALWPDVFQKSGSNILLELNRQILQKYTGVSRHFNQA